MFAIFRKPLIVTRQSPGAYVDGIWTPGGSSTFTIQGSVQPASQEDMQLLPEGRRVTGAYRIYTNETLQLARDGTNADIVEIDGDRHEVMADASWQNGIVPHRSYLVTRVVEGTI